MLNPVAEVPLCGATIAVGLAPPPRRHRYQPPWTEDAPVGEEEPEIVRLFAAHYRALLRLRQLTPAQRMHLTRLLGLCEAHLPECAGARPDAPGRADGDLLAASRQGVECLTAIRLYASGAQRALAIGNSAPVAHALASIITQVDRAHALLAAEAGSATPLIPKGLDHCS